jgi:uncharacterized protein
MSLTMHQASVAAFQRTLRALSAILDKAEAHATTNKIEPAVLLSARLFPDMFALTRQVQLTCDFAKNGAARLAGVEAPQFEDKEASFSDLKARIAATLAFIDGVKPNQVNGTEEKQITLKIGGSDRHFTGRDYLLFFGLPNFYFHAATAYDILRHNGILLGKRDFLGLN